MSDVQFSLPTSDVMEFDRRRRNAQSAYGGAINRLGLQRSRTETDFGRTFDGETIGGGAFGRTLDGFARQREQLPGQFIGRGLFNSGIFRNSVNTHFTNKRNALDDLEIRFARASQDFDLTEESLGQQLESALAAIEGDQNLRRSVYAQLISEAS